MKRYIKSSESKSTFNIPKENIIHITMYLRPEIYVESPFISASSNKHIAERYLKSRNAGISRRINGPLSDYGQELEPPIKQQYENFILDCIDAIEDEGFMIITKKRSTDSKKSEYILMYGMEDQPFGYIVYDLRISDHPLDATFPEEFKDEALNYLKMNNVIDGEATKAGINFRVEKVTVGSVTDDTWGRALDRLYNLLHKMRKRLEMLLKHENIEQSISTIRI